ncbi:NAD kinase [Micrococcus porci]|uniref:NAD kinase n=1 Tax=Micrococcus porci TaxID=2856555 RepID=UPI001CC8EEFA|nr:NAD kinase [Micrococcus porci]UBH23647.1 NAD kinase [Micrococcus porci]
MSETPSRRVLVLAHTGRADAIAAALQATAMLAEEGLDTVMLAEDVAAILESGTDAVGFRPLTLGRDCTLDDVQLGLVLGGDGSVLRAADFVRGHGIPLVAVNLGHVGFLAESERTDLHRTVKAIADGAYVVIERMALDVTVRVEGREVARTWALNEASVEKSNRERMLEVVVSVDDSPLTSFGCDGVVLASPTGSTAYAFSAGGPVVWPGVEALLCVPISAHALFSRPLVVGPHSTVAVDVLTRTRETGVLWCDGRRTVELPPRARIEVTRSAEPVRLARLRPTPFAERLVRKFRLPTEGWRGPVTEADRRTGPLAEVETVEPRHAAPRPDVVPPPSEPLTVLSPEALARYRGRDGREGDRTS